MIRTIRRYLLIALVAVAYIAVVFSVALSGLWFILWLATKSH